MTNLLASDWRKTLPIGKPAYGRLVCFTIRTLSTKPPRSSWKRPKFQALTSTWPLPHVSLPRISPARPSACSPQSAKTIAARPSKIWPWPTPSSTRAWCWNQPAFTGQPLKSIRISSTPNSNISSSGPTTNNPCGGGLKDRRPQLAELPWMMRDAKEAMKLTSRVSQHTTPIALPGFTMVDGVAVLAHSSVLGANPTGVRDEKQIAACDDLRLKLQANSGDWDSRQQLVYMLYDQGVFHEAASVIWDANPIPSIDLDLAFAARILAKDQPRKAIRLLTTVLELNRGKAVQNMGLANALLHYGMVLQAARFYGAALENDPNLVNPDLQHFILWTDDAQFLWENFKQRRSPLGNLPWPSVNPMEGLGIQFQPPPSGSLRSSLSKARSSITTSMNSSRVRTPRSPRHPPSPSLRTASPQKTVFSTPLMEPPPARTPSPS